MNKKGHRQTGCLFIRTRYVLFLTLMLCFTSVKLFAQDNPISLNLDNVRLEQALDAIERQSKYLFVYGDNVDAAQTVSISAAAKPLKDVLGELLAGTGIQYTVSNTSIVLSPAARAQTVPARRVSGRVTGENGNPISGATVLIKGTGIGSITGSDGEFSLNVPESKGDALLSVNFLGYEPRELLLGNKTSFNIVLKEAAVTVDEVVVTALGIRRSEKALSYNVQQVASDDIVGVKDANFINALNGKVAGVNINTSSSGIGGASKVVMRGSRAIETSSKALFVIDGVPMANYTRERTSVLSDSPFSSTGTTDMLADINPEDIESISVLTGAAAAALYGSNAGNGAIVINTKKGKDGATTVSFTLNTEFVSAFVKPEFQNRYGTSTDNRNMSWGRKLSGSGYMGYDPFDDYFKTGFTTTESVSFSTGTSKNQTYLSAAALNSEGIVPNNQYDRYNFTFRNTTKFLKDKMTLNVGASYVRQRDLNMTNQGVYSNPLASAYLYPRGNDWDNVKMFERYNTQDRIYEQYWNMDAGEYVLQNPYWINYRNLRENKKDRYMLNASLEYKVLDWLTLSGRASIDNLEDKGTTKNYATTNTQLTEMSTYGSYGESSAHNRMLYGDVMANVNKSFGDNWSLNAVVGASIHDDYVDGRTISGPIRDGIVGGESSLIPNVFNLNSISNSQTKKELYGWQEQMQSVFASAEVGFKGTYYLTATVRTDWASQLAGQESAQKSFTYPSVGLSLIVSEMFKMPEQISYLKLRGSYASVGLAFMRFLANPTYDYSNGRWSITNNYKLDGNLKPEFTHSFEVGLTARFLKHFNLDFTFYNTNTVNQTFNPNISPGSGYASMYVQAGKVRNRGVELSLGYGNRWNNFRWDTGVTLSANKNKILKLGGQITNADTGVSTSYSYMSMGGLGSSLKFLLQEGGSLGDLYTPLDLVRDHEGKIYVDNNGEIAIDTSNKSVDKWIKLGSIFPKANLSWRNDFSVSNLNFGFLVTARFGGVVYSRTQATLDYHGVSEASAAARDRGGISINGGDMVSAYNWYSIVGQSDGLAPYYTYDATNVRLQEASIGYTIPRKWLGNVCDITVSFVGRNLLMFYKRAPFDPEATATVNDNYYQGIDYFMMPSTRNLGFSVRIKF